MECLASLLIFQLLFFSPCLHAHTPKCTYYTYAISKNQNTIVHADHLALECLNRSCWIFVTVEWTFVECASNQRIEWNPYESRVKSLIEISLKWSMHRLIQSLIVFPFSRGFIQSDICLKPLFLLLLLLDTWLWLHFYSEF